ncbi:cytidine deaminase [Candidatus Roizmanbacteria bacterium CG09_land_8_20_14_0_10_41_9]|uniref:Cytidine deaminase n=1 Tax=Candidatus Roizmanbacteria bacterium CG09_land_8_20_14_0_10_41_9 TaxID=1974850 RepID=A0A2H0WUF5_9BACT|nr:MAG: cytidine deaminase [Candidatus Roizmanbacteria bacterium CG09_land_8_20_14_0_10_41_9]
MKKTFKRPEWDEYFIQIAHVVKTRSNCIRGRVGALIVKNKQILATGYNGTPSGIKNCFEGGCKRCWNRQTGKLKSGEKKDTCICLHAEQNALLQAAYHGISTNGADMYLTDSPCLQCAKMIINSGIKKIIAEKEFSDPLGTQLLKQAGVKLVILKR